MNKRKESYNRYNTSSGLLKRVIIRVDYEGMTSVDSWVMKLKQTISDKFHNYKRDYMTSNQVKSYRLNEDKNRYSQFERSILNEPVHSFMIILFRIMGIRLGWMLQIITRYLL